MLKRRSDRPVLTVFASLALLALSLLVTSAPALAAPDIVISGTPEFVMMVEAALDKFTAAGGRAGEIVAGLEGSSNDHVITEATDTAWTDYESTNDATTPDAGGTGMGSGSNVHWDPDFEPETKGTEDTDGDGVVDPLPNDACNILIHELSHAEDADQGTRDPRPDPGGSGIKTAEVEAVTDENRFRKADGQKPRNDYGCDPLPADAVCPPGTEVPSETPKSFLTLRLGGGESLAPFVEAPTATPTAVQPTMPAVVRSVALSGTSVQSLYQVGDEIQILLTLTNQGVLPMDLSGVLEGNFRVVSFTRDGVTVPTSSSSVETYEALAVLLQNSLVSVPPGGQITVPWFSHPSLTLGGEALTSVALASDGNHMSMGFAVDTPGDYAVGVVYKYAGTLPPNSNVFTSRTNTATIQFSVR